MFNLSKEVNRLYQLRHDKMHGLPDKPKHYNSKVKHIDGAPFDAQAKREGIFIPRGFKNKSMDFGRRLSKVKGQKHHPGGGYAGHTIKGG